MAMLVAMEMAVAMLVAVEMAMAGAVAVAVAVAVTEISCRLCGVRREQSKQREWRRQR